MKRRAFLGAAAAAGAGMAGCSAMGPRRIPIKEAPVPFSFGDNYPKPSGGTIPQRQLGNTGITVSTFGFGSHMRPYLRPYERERERMLREAYEMGVTTFDVYDAEHDVLQYEPTGRHLAPMINDVVLSIAIQPYDGRTLEQEFERDLRVFRRDHIDMVRLHWYSPDNKDWKQWEQLFKWKKEGKIRAVGVPIHYYADLFPLIDTYPVDYVIFPYNFFMNIAWDGHMMDDKYSTIPDLLRKRGIGIISMKPFAGDYLVTPLIDVAKTFPEGRDINFARAALKWVINSGLEPATTLTGMYYPSHVYENIDAYYNPTMTDDERGLLAKVARVAKTKAQALLPDHYRFFSKWVPGGLAVDSGIRMV